MEWLVVLLTVIVICLVLFKCKSNFQKEIPQTIWTFWSSKEKPPLIQKCLANFKKFNPDWTINVMNLDDVPEELRSLTPQRQSDWLRLNRLKDYGGVWLDASIILTEPLEWVRKIQQNDNTDGFMYYSNRHTVDKDTPVIESWFIAAVPQSPTIQKWFEEFDYACRKHGNDGRAYINDLVQRFGKGLQKKLLANIDMPDYLSVYISHQKVINIDKISSKDFSWELDETGPYVYHIKNAWNSEKTVKNLIEEPARYEPKLIKLIGSDRHYIRDDMKVHPESIFGKYL